MNSNPQSSLEKWRDALLIGAAAGLTLTTSLMGMRVLKELGALKDSMDRTEVSVGELDALVTERIRQTQGSIEMVVPPNTCDLPSENACEQELPVCTNE